MYIIHLTAVHPWNDTRIYLKMCRSLVVAGHTVHLVAPRNDIRAGSVEAQDGVVVHSVAKHAGRFRRMTRTVRDVLDCAAKLNGDVYHFHDPEILRLAPHYQRWLGKPFIFDAHEDYREGIRNKTWIPSLFRMSVANIAGVFEDHAVAKLAGVIAATPHIARHYASHHACSVIQNYPIANELAVDTGKRKPEKGLFVYVGGVSELRGAKEMASAVGHARGSAKLAVAGEWADRSLLDECRNISSSERLLVLGQITRHEMKVLLSGATAGLVLYKPAGNHLYAQPNKLFEYMSAGIPIIASNFPLWREIVEGNRCGICVDPLDTEAIAAAMSWMMAHPVDTAVMGERGRSAVVERYRWDSEFEKLIDLYCRVTG